MLAGEGSSQSWRCTGLAKGLEPGIDNNTLRAGSGHRQPQMESLASLATTPVDVLVSRMEFTNRARGQKEASTSKTAGERKRGAI